MIVSIKKTEEGTLISVVDDEIFNKIFEEGDFVLDIDSDFFQGEKIDDSQKIVQLLKEAYSGIIIGEKSTKLALTSRIISKTNKIKGISYAFFVSSK